MTFCIRRPYLNIFLLDTVDSLLHGMEVVDLKRSVVLPDWLRNEDAIPVEEKRDSRDLTMRELSKNVNHEFGVEEKKTGKLLLLQRYFLCEGLQKQHSLLKFADHIVRGLC